MSKLVELVKSAGIFTGTSLSAYLGIEAGAVLAEHVPQNYLLPQIVNGACALIAGSIGMDISRKVTGRERLSLEKAISVCALHAFAHAPDNSRAINARDSFDRIRANLVEVKSKYSGGPSFGSGLQVTTQGYVLTAYHVIKNAVENGGRIYARREASGKGYRPVDTGEIWFDEDADVAVVKITGPVLKYRAARININRTGNLKKGDSVQLLGLHQGQVYNTLGRITEPGNANGNGLFRTDALGKPGQSGGVIANSDGELIGLIISKSSSKLDIGEVVGVRIAPALRGLDEIASRKSRKMFE